MDSLYETIKAKFGLDVEQKSDGESSLLSPLQTGYPGSLDDDLPTHTSQEQAIVEGKVEQLLNDWNADPNNLETTLLRRQDHIYYLVRALHALGEGYTSLDASRPWIVYWVVHSLDLLGTLHQLPPSMIERILDFLSRCQHPDGGFGGGPGQISHVAPTFASVMTLCILANLPQVGSRAYEMIDRQRLYNWMLTVKDSENKGFCTTFGGEVDSRSTYCAVAVASMCNIITPQLVEGTSEYLARCQTYEGGLGGEPGNEAHGGYTYCGLAAMMMLQKEDLLDIPQLLKWAVYRQMPFEGGFQGRCNKLVDGCYSFWVGALFPLVDFILRKRATDAKDSKASPPPSSENWLFDHMALQRYLLVCCQMNSVGGLRDKPGKRPDHYHTCYCLSGLSVAQHSLASMAAPSNASESSSSTSSDSPAASSSSWVLGSPENRLRPTNPLYNICVDRLTPALAYFSALPLPAISEANSQSS